MNSLEEDNVFSYFYIRWSSQMFQLTHTDRVLDNFCAT